MTLSKKQELCIACQECCKWMEFGIEVPHLEIADILKEYYEAHGCKVRKTFRTNKWEVLILVPSWCQHIRVDGCAIYENRYKICRDYDGRKDPMISDICKWNELKEG